MLPCVTGFPWRTFIFYAKTSTGKGQNSKGRNFETTIDAGLIFKD